jgi:predicted dienelactone hydrolase
MPRYILIAAAFFWAAIAPALAVGFQTATVPDPGNPPIFVGIWYPSDAPARPERISLDMAMVAHDGALAGDGLTLIVMSHGQGGGFAGHVDTAIALAQAGFVVAAPTHTGDNFKDGSKVLAVWDRARQLRVVTDWLLKSWSGHTHLRPAQIGLFGFSAGGFTALVDAGGVPDLALIGPHCAAMPAEFTCNLIAHAKAQGASQPPLPKDAWVHDPRVKAAVVAAPALGFTFGRSGLAKVSIPIQLWRGSADTTLPQPFYAQAVADALPRRPDYHVVPGAQHLDFLSPCDAFKAQTVPAICQSAPGFDRSSFHKAFNAAVVKFFEASLKEE